MQYQCLRFSAEGRIASAVLSLPEEGNRIDARMLSELDDVALTVAEMPQINVLVISAEGADFCLGWEPAKRETLIREPRLDPFASIAALSCATVAAIQGRALSAGLELALACDIRVAAPDAHFAVPEVTEGLLPFAGATQRLPRIAGKAAALEMLLLGEEHDAAYAYRCGLVSRLAEGSLADEVASVANAIAARGPLAVRYAREATTRGMEMSLEQGLRYEADLSVLLQTTEDRAEGLRAFFEKRPPEFTGR